MEAVAEEMRSKVSVPANPPGATHCAMAPLVSETASVETQGVVQLLMLPEAYRAPRQHIFQSEQSLKWHMRAHKKRLAEAGALFRICGRSWIQPGAYDQVLLEDGRAGAAGSDE